MYQAAGAAYHVNPYVLAALHKTESDYSSDPAAFHPNSAGALGPMQFLPSTWAGYANAYRADRGPAARALPAHVHAARVHHRRLRRDRRRRATTCTSSARTPSWISARSMR